MGEKGGGEGGREGNGRGGWSRGREGTGRGGWSREREGNGRGAGRFAVTLRRSLCAGRFAPVVFATRFMPPASWRPLCAASFVPPASRHRSLLTSLAIFSIAILRFCSAILSNALCSPLLVRVTSTSGMVVGSAPKSSQLFSNLSMTSSTLSRSIVSLFLCASFWIRYPYGS